MYKELLPKNRLKVTATMLGLTLLLHLPEGMIGTVVASDGNPDSIPEVMDTFKGCR